MVGGRFLWTLRQNRGAISINIERQRAGGDRFMWTERGQNRRGGDRFLLTERPKRGGGWSVSVDREAKTGGAIDFCERDQNRGRSISVRVGDRFLWGEQFLLGGNQSVSKERQNRGERLGELESRGEGNENSEIVEC
jgi:hypothetical protein